MGWWWIALLVPLVCGCPVELEPKPNDTSADADVDTGDPPNGADTGETSSDTGGPEPEDSVTGGTPLYWTGDYEAFGWVAECGSYWTIDVAPL